jgi:hypothetical protein
VRSGVNRPAVLPDHWSWVVKGPAGLELVRTRSQSLNAVSSLSA